MFLSVGASTEAKALHVCSVGSVSTRHAVVCVFLAFIKITISPLIYTSITVAGSGKCTRKLPGAERDMQRETDMRDRETVLLIVQTERHQHDSMCVISNMRSIPALSSSDLARGF